jgi:3-deoxy-D-manno-octulosonic-acid transferase
MTKFPTTRLRRFLGKYTFLWTVGLPLALLYLLWRARRDPLYIKHLPERFGFTRKTATDAVWVHAVSLGELRSAVPLIRRFIDDGEHVVTTHFTPTGRREAEAVFADDIADGRLQVMWVPLEFRWCYRRFFRAFTPKIGLVMEIEIWPIMIDAAHKAGIKLFPCNAQYPQKSFARDQVKSKWRADLMQGYAGGFVKSNIQKNRFAAAGMANIHVTGELRFDQPIPEKQRMSGELVKQTIPRKVVTIASVVVGEDAQYIALIHSLLGPDAPLIVYVPRAPERFDECYDLLTSAGLNVTRRSIAFDADLAIDSFPKCDVLLGDSMGEMYFYLALCDQAIIGGSFIPQGAHNISEPLALGKPVVLGPNTWTIEFPFEEAKAAGVATQVQNIPELVAYLQSGKSPSQEDVDVFFETQSGAVERTHTAISQVLRDKPN